MPTLADYVAAYTRTPSARCYLNGQRWYGITRLSFHQRFPENVSSGEVEGRAPPAVPTIGMSISWTWGYNGQEVAGFTGEVSDVTDQSYPDRYKLQVKDVLWRADKAEQVLQTSPLNDIAASAAVRYLLTHYGGISSSRLQIPTLPASGAAWAGSEWKLGQLTPVQWGDPDTNTGGTTALAAAAQICVCLGYWLHATAAGKITAKAMEKRPASTAREVFRRNVNLLIQGAPERQASYDSIRNQVTVRGANTGVAGAQLLDQRQTAHPLLPSGVYRDLPFSSPLLEYENASDAGAASVASVATRLIGVVSRVPDVVPLRAKADPNRRVGDTVGLIDTGVRLTSQKNYFIYGIDRELDLLAGRFDDRLLLDGGTGSTGYTTIPAPDASFSWRLMAETLDGDAVVEVFLDGSASTSPTGEIVSWSWSTSTTTYGSTPNSATGETAVFFFLASSTPATITLTVVDTTSKNATFEADVDLTGADTAAPIQETVSVAAGAAWLITPDGGATWHSETSSGAAIAVGTIGAGADDRAAVGSAATYGLLATRGALGAGGLRVTLDALATASTNLVANAAAITSNIWQNEAEPSRVWFAIGTAVYRSLDGGATKTAMHAAPASVSWIMEDPAVENSVFLLAGADMYNATDPTVGWALLYAGPVGATARQFVRSRDGQVTWVAFTGAPSGEALQRVETGAAADFTATDVRTLALDKDASSVKATLYAITGDDPAQLWSFDGLTGLSAAQSANTFPAGATVQHMLGSRQADLFYTANFDGVTTGTGQLHKYFPEADQLLLWKALDSGQQGHMLGLGAAHAVQIEIVLLPSNASGAADKLFHYVPGTGWASITPPQASYYWLGMAAAPDAPDTWLLWGNTAGNAQMDVSAGVVKAAGTGNSPAYVTTDAGATWTAVTLSGVPGGATSATLEYLTWDDAGGGGWRAVANKVGSPFYPTYLWVSSGTSGSVTTTTATQVEILIGASGLSGDLVVADFASPYKLGYYTSSGTLTEPSGSGPGGALGSFTASDRLGGPSPLIATLKGSDLWLTTDYRDHQPTSAIASIGGSYLTCTYEAAYISAVSGGGVTRVASLAGTPSSSAVGPTGTTTGPVRQARQDRATTIALAVRLDPTVSKDLHVSADGLTWSYLQGPAAANVANLALVFEVLTR